MKILIIGCGKIGVTILESLLAEGHDITAMDSNPKVIEEITNIYDVMTYCGSGTDCEALSEAQAENTDLVISVTGSDEFNMLSCFLARRMGAKHTVARIRNPEYNAQSLDFIKKEMNISLTINPELLVAHELFNILKLPTTSKVETFSRGSLEMVEITVKEDCGIDGLSLIDLKRKYPGNYLVCAVERGEEVFIPDGNFTLKTGDKIGITAGVAALGKLLKNLNLSTKKAKDIMILGATTTAFYLAKLLLASGNTVKIIDPDAARCTQFCEQLHDAVIINGDGTHQELLLEEGIDKIDAFVALTGLDEENILLSYFASTQNVPKVITKVSRTEFLLTAQKLGLECIVSPRRSIAGVAVRYARALQNSIGSKVETLYKLMNGKAEALEFEVTADCSIVNIPLKQLMTRPNILIAGIVRSRKTIIPTGDDMILPGDRVVVFTAGHRLGDLSDIVKR